MLTKKSLLDAVKKEQAPPVSKNRLQELLQVSGEDFIHTVFWAVLRREPDPLGRYYYLSKLRSRELTKLEIIAILRYSGEGRAAATAIPGLAKPQIMAALMTSWIKKKIRRLKPAFLSGLSVFSSKQPPGSAGLSFEAYADFESRFRGKEEDIKVNLGLYLPAVTDLIHRFDHVQLQAVDIGCGRGEWLELMEDKGVRARGIDINPIFLNRIKEKGLTAEKKDLFDFLKRSKAGSFHLITAFHVIEHIDINLRADFLHEVLRVLAPGGICILETPNPRHLLVGSSDFYRDPSHETPVFPDTLQFMGTAVGFGESFSYFFEENKLVPVDNVRFDTLEDYISVSRDFAWIGKKINKTNAPA